MSLQQEIQRDLERVEQDMVGPDGVAQTLVFGDLTVPCVPTSIAEATVMDEEGNMQTVSVSVFVRIEHFNLWGEQDDEVAGEDAPLSTTYELPKCGHIVRFRWNYYRVVRVQLTGTQSHIRLDLADSGSNQ
jgi:hypothetical protein